MNNQPDLYAPILQRARDAFVETGLKQTDGRQIRGMLNITAATAKAVIYRLIKDGTLTATSETTSYWRPTRPGSGLSSTAKKTQVTYTIRQTA